MFNFNNSDYIKIKNGRGKLSFKVWRNPDDGIFINKNEEFYRISPCMIRIATNSLGTFYGKDPDGAGRSLITNMFKEIYQDGLEDSEVVGKFHNWDEYTYDLYNINLSTLAPNYVYDTFFVSLHQELYGNIAVASHTKVKDFKITYTAIVK